MPPSLTCSNITCVFLFAPLRTKHTTFRKQQQQQKLYSSVVHTRFCRLSIAHVPQILLAGQRIAVSLVPALILQRGARKKTEPLSPKRLSENGANTTTVGSTSTCTIINKSQVRDTYGTTLSKRPGENSEYTENGGVRCGAVRRGTGRGGAVICLRTSRRAATDQFAASIPPASLRRANPPKQSA